MLQFCIPLCANRPISRDSDFIDGAVPSNIINITLLQQITEKLCDILDIKKYETTSKGGLGVCNLGGPTHDDENIKCWDHPLMISDSNPTFEGINIVRIKENITFKPNTNTTCPVTTQQAAIIVAKDDMTIDLSGFAITMDGQKLNPVPPVLVGPDNNCSDPGCIPAVHGIYIMPGVKNTRIISTQSDNTHTRGSIKKFTGFGIYMAGDTGVGKQVEEVFVNNLRIYNCYNGIYAQHASNVNITRTEANNNCNYNTVHGMHFVNVSELYVVGCQASSNRACNNVYGMRLQDTTNALIQDCQTSKNISATTSNTGSVYGIHISGTSPTTSFANTVQDCKASGNICADTVNSECVGVLLGDQSAHNIVQNCTILSNDVAGINNSPNAYGIRLDNSHFNEVTENKVGCNATSVSISGHPGISDSLTAGSTSLFTSNVSFFNGHQGGENFNIKFKKNSGETEDFKATIIYAANLEGVSTNVPTLGNLDIKKPS